MKVNMRSILGSQKSSGVRWDKQAKVGTFMYLIRVYINSYLSKQVKKVKKKKNLYLFT